MELNKIWNEIYCESCLDTMKRMEDKSVDMILCDLPYGTTACKWDVIIPFEPLWEQYKRIIKDNGAIVLTASQPFTSALVMSNVNMFKQSLVWEKTRPTNVFNAKKQFMKWHEDVLIFYSNPPTFNPQMRTDGQFSGAKVQRENHDRMIGTMGRTGLKKDYFHQPNGGLFYPKSILKYPTEMHTSTHPTQKPVALFEYLIKTYTNENETVYDGCMGSGTTAIACINTKRNFIGSELDKGYYDIALNRIQNAQQTLL